jgi:hypothetical protein
MLRTISLHRQGGRRCGLMQHYPFVDMHDTGLRVRDPELFEEFVHGADVVTWLGIPPV